LLAMIAAMGGLLAAAGSAPAGIIVQYPLNTTSPADFGPTNTPPGVTASLLTEASALQNYSTNHHQSLPGLQLEASPRATTFPTSVDDAFSSTKLDYFSFTVTPPPGKAFFLTSLTFNVAAGGTTNGAFIRETGVRSSLTDGTDLYTTTGLPGGGLPTFEVTPNVPLTFPVFQNITGPVTFSFAVDTPNGNDTIDFNDITLNGTVGPIIPEPPSLGAWLLFGTVGCWCLWRQRRSRRAVMV